MVTLVKRARFANICWWRGPYIKSGIFCHRPGYSLLLGFKKLLRDSFF